MPSWRSATPTGRSSRATSRGDEPWPRRSTSTSPRRSRRCPRGDRASRCRPIVATSTLTVGRPRPVRLPTRQQASRPGRPLAALPAARVSTPSARRATRATPPSPPRCVPPIPLCCTTVQVDSSCSGPARWTEATRCGTCCSDSAAATDEPISGGRHKVFGRRDLNVIPQTSTIASHLPRAVGVAFSIGRAGKLGDRQPVAARRRHRVQLRRRVGEPLDRGRRHQHRDSRCLPRTSAAAAVRLRGQRDRHQHQDADRAGSLPTSAVGTGLEYFTADGFDVVDTHAVATAAVDWVRKHRRPAFLHLRTVRLMAHAGSDVEAAYRTPAEIAADYERDPLLGTAKLLIAQGGMSPADDPRPLRGQARGGHRDRRRGRRAAPIGQCRSGDAAACTTLVGDATAAAPTGTGADDGGDAADRSPSRSIAPCSTC